MDFGQNPIEQATEGYTNLQWTADFARRINSDFTKVKKVATSRANITLVDCVLCRVAFARHHFDLHVFPLLISHL